MSLPVAVYASAQVRALDRYAIDVTGIPSYTLMERAAAASLRLLRTRYPAVRRIALVCGGGNNGGDGYVMARLALTQGLPLDALAASSPERLSGDAQRAHADWLAAGGTVAPFTAAALANCELIVDAFCGTGLRDDLRPDARAVVAAINAAAHPVLSLDVPSGLCSDTGRVLGAVVQADATISFVGLKQGFYLGQGPRYCGEIVFDSLGIEAPARPDFAPRLKRLPATLLRDSLMPRARDAHKGDFGTVVIVGGGAGMPGAVALAGRAALRVGAGKVRIACALESQAAVAAQSAEIMVAAVDDATALRAALHDATVILLGPGLGQGDWAQCCWRATLDFVRAHRLPVVMDADALNLLALEPNAERASWILTPHPGEAARLLGCGTAELQSDRLGCLTRLLERYGGVTVLKGAATLIGASGETPAVCDRGNPGMATAGMGDVLAGALAGLLAQLGDPYLAAQLAVLAHAQAGDVAAARGQRGLLAGDVIEQLRAQVNSR